MIDRIEFLKKMVYQTESELRLGEITLQKYYETIADINRECDKLETELKKDMGLFKWLWIKMTLNMSAHG